MPTTDELKQRLHATAQQEHGEFAMALLVSEVIDPQIEGKKLRQSFIVYWRQLTNKSRST